MLTSCTNGDRNNEIEIEDTSNLVINENSFMLNCKVDDNYSYSYEFSWTKSLYVNSYKVKLDNEEDVISTDGKFTAYDIVTQCETDDYETMEECLTDISKQIACELEANETAPTENEIKNDKYCKKLMNYFNCKIKYVNIDLD